MMKRFIQCTQFTGLATLAFLATSFAVNATPSVPHQAKNRANAKAAASTTEMICGLNSTSNEQQCTELKNPTDYHDQVPSRQAHPAAGESSRLRQMIQKMRTHEKEAAIVPQQPEVAAEPAAVKDDKLDGEEDAPSLWN
jgi:hypothetical protein